MKICPFCGAQLDDSVSFCSTCGNAQAPVAAATPVTPVAPVAPVAPNKPYVSVLGFISKLFSIFSAMFIGCGLAAAYLDIDVNLSSYTYNLYAHGYFEPDESCAIMALLTALAALVLAIIAFIRTLVKRGGAEKILASIAQMVATFAALIVSFVMLANA